MASADDLAAAKRRVSAAVLRLPGVAGVGVPEHGVTVYIEDNSPELRSRLKEVVDKLALAVPVNFEVSGKFHRF